MASSRVEWYECEKCGFLVVYPLACRCGTYGGLSAPGEAPRKAPKIPKRRLNHWGNCFYCGLYYEHLTVDHVIPKSRGRQFDRPWNMVWVCSFCNHKKADLSLVAWLSRVARMTPSEFGHGPRHRGIMERRETIRAKLMERPELRRYPSQIGVFLP